MSYTYAGIGNKNVEVFARHKIKEVCTYLNELNCTCRSGGAEGSDSFFEEFANECELYLPWRSFNGIESTHYKPKAMHHNIAEKCHPNWYRCKYTVKALHARNAYILCGEPDDKPVDFVVCYCRDTARGGTAHALRCAEYCNIKVFNIVDYLNGDCLIESLISFINNLKT